LYVYYVIYFICIFIICYIYIISKAGPFVLCFILLLRIETNLAYAGLNSAHVEYYKLNKLSLYDCCVIEIF